MKVYIAAPLFNEMERRRNSEIAELIETLGVTTYLPQRDGGLVAELKEKNKNCDGKEIEKKIYNKDIEAMNECDILLFLLDGAVLDDGSCFELGYMYANGKKCIGYMTDVRNFGDGNLNLMIQYSLENISHDYYELLRCLNEIKNSQG